MKIGEALHYIILREDGRGGQDRRFCGGGYPGDNKTIKKFPFALEITNYKYVQMCQINVRKRRKFYF